MLTWEQRFARARNRTRTTRGLFGFRGSVVPDPGFSAEDKHAAWNWNTCAIGESVNRRGVVVELVPDAANQQLLPTDKQLQALGRGFHAAVQADRIDEAEMTYLAVQRRMRELDPTAGTRDVDNLLNAMVPAPALP